jgi:uncharacterized protein YjbJ (UPF0337 family)
MGDRLHEMKGNLKEGMGRMTGDDGLEAEGAAEADTAKAHRETVGAAHHVGGSVKEGFGKLTGDPELEGEGKADKLRGKVERAG